MAGIFKADAAGEADATRCHRKLGVSSSASDVYTQSARGGWTQRSGRPIPSLHVSSTPALLRKRNGRSMVSGSRTCAGWRKRWRDLSMSVDRVPPKYRPSVDLLSIEASTERRSSVDRVPIRAEHTPRTCVRSIVCGYNVDRVPSPELVSVDCRSSVDLMSI